MEMEFEKIRSLVSLMGEFNLSEVKIEMEGCNLCLRRNCAPEVTAVPVAVPAVAAAPVPAAIPAPAAAPAPVAGGEKINAPMPGNILDVKVAAGQMVKKGDVLVILEAMKMENEIMAPRDGKVAQVACTKGATVNTGDVLLSLS